MLVGPRFSIAAHQNFFSEVRLSAVGIHKFREHLHLSTIYREQDLCGLQGA
jgi:hypothetical protein